MARKVLISFLGTNDYFPVYYTWGEKERKTTDHRTRFIQEAIATKLCKSWSKDDCIMVFRTNESNTANWLDNDGKEGLKTTLGKITGLRCKINPESVAGKDDYIIPVGFKEDELWDIFKCVFDKIEPEDDIYFDVTHAFRTIPMFADVLFNYARFLKHSKVSGVYYGAFEILGPLYKIKALPEAEQEKLTVPVVDLTNIVRLQEINTAASSFRDFGMMSAFSNILYETGISELDSTIKDISKALEDLDFYIQTCRIDDIRRGEYMKVLEDKMNEFCNSAHTNEAQRKLISEMHEQLKRYEFVAEEDYINVEAAIKWAIDHNMIQQAYTMAKEYLISTAYDFLCDLKLEDAFIKELKITDSNSNIAKYKIREALGSILRAKKGKSGIYDKRWNTSKIAQMLVQKERYFRDITQPYSKIADRRNNLNHANAHGDQQRGGESFADYRNEFLTYWQECVNVLDSL
ncbi:MAG: TIGR02221 family CRISPR-associated protein [Bacteroides sp.]|nr:TIGR02221 family CRISPR-associated protein [Bacteroides sp.]